MKIWIKINRLSAWILLGCMLLYFISGFGMTKGFISYQNSSKLHLDILTTFVMVAFVIHAAFATRLALIRWGIWLSYGKYIWTIFYVLFIFGFIYIDKLYVKPQVNQNTQSATFATTTTSDPTLTTTAMTSSQPTYTLSELAKYNGTNGQSAYAAIDGIIYDFSSIFENGDHKGYTAGQDLTSEFYSQHNASILSSFTVVGKLAK